MTRMATAERGSAYLLAMTVLIVLTGLGIVLSGIGLTERRLASADGEYLEAVNAANSGLAIATARLLAGEEPEELEIVLAISRWIGSIRTDRVTIAQPTLLAVVLCRACDSEGGEWARVSYRVAASGQREVWRLSSSSAGSRVLARAAVGATVTLQPWPAPGAAPSSPGGDAGLCAPEAYARAHERLTRELYTPGCRFASTAFDVRTADASTGAICSIRLPVCVLLTDWHSP